MDDASPQPDALDDAIPAELTDPAARAEWRRAIVPAIRIGQITAADPNAAAGTLRTVRGVAVASGGGASGADHCIITGKHGYLVPHPVRVLASRTLAELTKIDGELGFTPTSRSRVTRRKGRSRSARRSIRTAPSFSKRLDGDDAGPRSRRITNPSRRLPGSDPGALRADLVITDPPFGIADAPITVTRADRYCAGRRLGVANTWHPASAWDRELDPSWLPLALAVAPIVALFGHWRKRVAFETAAGMEPRAEIVWAKNTHVGAPCPVAYRDEWIWLFGTAAIHPLRFETSVWDDAVIPTWQYKFHKNEKPLKLIRRLVSWLPGAIVLDPFVGSGTTLVAAKAAGRSAIGIDINEHGLRKSRRGDLHRTCYRWRRHDAPVLVRRRPVARGPLAGRSIDFAASWNAPRTAGKRTGDATTSTRRKPIARNRFSRSSCRTISASLPGSRSCCGTIKRS